MNIDQERILDELLSLTSGLTGWEMGFLDTLDQGYRDRDLELSVKQSMILQTIYDKIGGRTTERHVDRGD